MNTLWIDDLKEFNLTLTTINRRLDIDDNDTEASATLEVSDKTMKVVATKFHRHHPKQVIELAITFNTDYQTSDEVLSWLNKLLNIKKEI